VVERPAPVGSGTITLRALSPGSGGTLSVGDCLFGAAPRACAEEWRGVFDVTYDRDVVHAVLTVSFFDGDRLCGYAADTADRIPAGGTVTFRPARISLTDEWGVFSPPCALPVTTTRVVASLWTDADWTVAANAIFDSTYSFLRR
jgi:hypothetical protein